MDTLSPTRALEPSVDQRLGKYPRFGAKRDRKSATRPSWLLALPGLALILILVYAPSIAGSYYAFTDWDGLTHARWIGTENFQRIFSDTNSRGPLWRTVQITIAFTITTNILGLGLAIGLNRSLKTRNLLRAIFFAPMVVSSVAIGFLWKYIFQVDGPLNNALGALGLENLQHPWLGDPKTALWAILVVMLWQISGLTMAIYLAGLSSIPDEHYEAAAVDGAGWFRQFRKITVPALSAAITINISLALLNGFRLFDQVLALTNGGPANSTQTLQTEIYGQAFTLGKFGYSAALAVLLSVLLVGAVLTLMLLSWAWKKWRA